MKKNINDNITRLFAHRKPASIEITETQRDLLARMYTKQAFMLAAEGYFDPEAAALRFARDRQDYAQPRVA